jgi:cell pole-organizing protein PopZ
MAEQSAHEPTMEEILASIRRIISEDDAPEAAAAQAVAEPEAEDEDDAFAAASEPEADVEEASADSEDDVLELTETYEAPESVSIGDIDAYTPPATPEPKPAPRPVASAPSSAGGLVSERTESIAASSFGTLTSNLLVPHSDRTLEDVAKELLRPLLQSWLDQHLPGIVEEQVRLEVERIARQSRR